MYVKAFVHSNVLVFSNNFPMEFLILGSLCRSCWHGIFTLRVDQHWRKIRFNFRICIAYTAHFAVHRLQNCLHFLQLCRPGGTVLKLVKSSKFRAIYLVGKIAKWQSTLCQNLFTIQCLKLKEATFL